MTRHFNRFAPFALWLFLLLCLVLIPAAVLAEEGYISGMAYLDANTSGSLDSEEQLLSGVPLALQQKTDKGWERVADLVTDEEGCYTFSGLKEGSYRVISAMQSDTYCISSLGEDAGWTNGLFHSAEIAVTDGEITEGPSVGVSEAVPFSVFTYCDSNGNGEQDGKEKALSGAVVRFLSDDTVTYEAVSGTDGIASFSAPQGQYTLYVSVPGGYGILSLDGDSSFAGLVSSATRDLTTGAQGISIQCAVVSVVGISGRVFEDVNGNGIMDDEDLPVSGVTVHAVRQKTNEEYQAVSDESGNYMIILPNAGKYTITADIPEGMLYTRYTKDGGDLRSIFSRTNISREFSVKSKALTNKNIGIVQQGAITGYAFLDTNYNSLWDEGEPVYAGVTIEVIKVSNETSYGKVKTDQNGYFIVENLRGGDYRIRAILPDDGSIFSAVSDGDASDVNLFRQNGIRRESSVEPITIISGSQAEILVGVARGSTVTGTVFQDKDYSGTQNGKEKGISGIKVRAVSEDGTVAAEATTAKNGGYELTGILPGTYHIEIARKSGYGFTRNRSAEKGGSHVLTIVEDWGVCENFTIGMDEKLQDINAGMLPSATVKGQLVHDSNDNGAIDKGETALPGAKVRLFSEDAEMDFTVTPDEDGNFRVDGVMPGTYTLEYLLPEHCEMTSQQLVTEDVLKVVSGESYELPSASAVVLGTWEGNVLCGNQPVEGAQFIISGQKGGTAEAVSDENGAFSITGLHPDEYELTVKLPEGYIFAPAEEGLELSWPSDSVYTQTVDWQLLSAHTVQTVKVLVPAVISGQVWMDENKNGTQESDEWILESLEIQLLDEADQVVAQTTTDENGYCFDKVRPGQYRVFFAMPEQASPVGEAGTLFAQSEGGMCTSAFTIREGETREGLNVGLVSTTSLGGYVVLTEGGQYLPQSGVAVSLLQNGSVLQNTVTAEDGSYRFDGLWPNDYQVRVTLPAGCIFIRENDTNFEAGATLIHADSGSTADSPAIKLEMAQHQLNLNVLCIKSGMIGDLAWLDENANGLLDGDEQRLAGIKVRLIQDGVVRYERETNAFGYYLFDDVYPGTYMLEAEAYEELNLTKQVPSLRIISSCLISGDGSKAQSETFTVESGMKDMNYDLGYVLKQGASLPEAAVQTQPTKDWTLVNEPAEMEQQ